MATYLYGTVATFFLVCAAAGGAILIVQLLLGGLGADSSDAGDAGDMGDLGDVGDAGDVADHEGHVHAQGSAGDAGLQLFSVRALCAGVTFFGIGGLGILSAGLPSWLAVVTALLLGPAAMFAVAIAMRAMLRMERDATVRTARAVGLTGEVYLPVPSGLSGVGKVLLVQRGRTVEYQAVTPQNVSLATGAKIVVVAMRENDILEVVPLPIIDGVP